MIMSFYSIFSLHSSKYTDTDWTASWLESYRRRRSAIFPGYSTRQYSNCYSMKRIFISIFHLPLLETLMRLNLVDNDSGYCLAVDIAIRVRNTKVCQLSSSHAAGINSRCTLIRKSPRSIKEKILMAIIVHRAVSRMMFEKIKSVSHSLFFLLITMIISLDRRRKHPPSLRIKSEMMVWGYWLTCYRMSW